MCTGEIERRNIVEKETIQIFDSYGIIFVFESSDVYTLYLTKYIGHFPNVTLCKQTTRWHDRLSTMVVIF